MVVLFWRYCCCFCLIYVCSVSAYSQTDQGSLKKAIFAGGCFWCVEHAFDDVPGVTATVSGYIGGHVKNPNYHQVSGGNTGHLEAVEVTYDPGKVTYQKLLQVFWHNIDPTDATGQFCDKGYQYTSAIFYLNNNQKKLAEASKKEILKNKVIKKIYTRIIKATVFYPAEEYHQDYYLKNPARYKFYRYLCGRDQRLQQLWG